MINIVSYNNKLIQVCLFKINNIILIFLCYIISILMCLINILTLQYPSLFETF